MADSYSNEREEANAKPQAPELTVTQKGRPAMWLERFWDNYKWVIIISVFFLIVLVVGIVQMVNKEEYDQSIVFAGPAMLTPNQSAEIGTAFSELLPDDYNGDDKLLVKFWGYGVYDEDEMKAANEAETLPNGQFNTVVTAHSNSSATSQYKEYMMSGECAIFFVSPTQYENLCLQERLCSMDSVFGGEIPKGTTSDGFGVRLGDIELYSIPEFKFMPEDTIICLLRQPIIGKCSKDSYYRSATEFFKALVVYEG